MVHGGKSKSSMNPFNFFFTKLNKAVRGKLNLESSPPFQKKMISWKNYFLWSRIYIPHPKLSEILKKQPPPHKNQKFHT